MKSGTVTLLLLAATASASLADVAAPTGEKFRQQSDRQQEVRTQTATVAQQIDSISDEFSRNGLADDPDARTLRQLHDALGSLDAGQMQQVIQLLQQAADAANGNGSAATAKQAFSVQQNIIVRFRQMLAEFQKRQGLAALAKHAEELSQRQSANLRAAVDTATNQQIADAKPDRHLGDPTAMATQAQHTEQSDLANDASDLLAAAKSMQKDATGDDADRLKKALADPQTQAGIDAAKAASAELQAGTLYRAAADEKTARDALRKLAEALAPPRDPQAVRQEQLAALDALSQKQHDLAEETKHPDWHMGEPATLQQAASKQAANTDDAQDVQRKLQALSPQTTDKVKQAEQHMQEARAQLTQRQRGTAVDDETRAAAMLDAARRQLQQEIAAADAQKTAPVAGAQPPPDQQNGAPQQAGSPQASTPQAGAPQSSTPGTQEQARAAMAQLKHAQDQIGQLIQQQAQLATTPQKKDDPQHQQNQQQSQQQKSLAQQTDQALKNLPAEAQAAAEPMQKAQQQMQDASQELKQNSNGDAHRDQAKALAHLAQAAAEVNAQMQQLQDQAGQPDQGSKSAQATIDQAAKDVQQAKDAMDKQDGNAAARAQQRLAEAAKNAARAISRENNAQADGPLQQAIEQVSQAAQASADENPDAAKAAAEKASQALAQAKSMPENGPQQAMADAQQSPPDQQKSQSSQQKSDAQSAADPKNAGDHAVDDGGPKNTVADAGSIVRLPARDRAALTQSQAEKYPQEYGPVVEQYLRDLANDPGTK